MLKICPKYAQNMLDLFQMLAIEYNQITVDVNTRFVLLYLGLNGINLLYQNLTAVTEPAVGVTSIRNDNEY